MTRQELRAKAREDLGGGIFKNAWLMALLAVLVYSVIYSAGASIAIGALILYGPLTYGLNKMFLMKARGNYDFKIGDLFSGFSEDFAQTFLLGLLQSIFIALWSLLFVIPGIVKTYSYSMCFYIKADHPEYTWKECLDSSKEMMNGHKMELFILELSFIGWLLLGSIACGIGILWVEPYMLQTEAEFYESIK